MEDYIWIIIGTLVFLVVLYLLMCMPKRNTRLDRPFFPKRQIAHRGLFDKEKQIPENSLKAFSNAVKNGYGIEFDVQETKDGKLVVFHDWTLKRMCGDDRKISDLTLGEIKQYTLGDTECRIPTLEEALQLVDGQVPLLVELKSRDHRFAGFCQSVWNILKDYQGAYVIESFHPLVLCWFRRHAPKIKRGQLADNFLQEESTGNIILDALLTNMLANFLAKPDFIAYNIKHKNSLSLLICSYVYNSTTYAWTVRNKKQQENSRKRFDCIIFDSFLPET